MLSVCERTNVIDKWATRNIYHTVHARPDAVFLVTPRTATVGAFCRGWRQDWNVISDRLARVSYGRQNTNGHEFPFVLYDGSLLRAKAGRFVPFRDWMPSGISSMGCLIKWGTLEVTLLLKGNAMLALVIRHVVEYGLGNVNVATCQMPSSWLRTDHSVL